MRALLLGLLAALALGVLAALLVSSPASAKVNCSTFSTQGAAQTWFLANGGPSSDPEGLDGDRDGIACESLKCPCNYSKVPTSAPPTVTAPPATTESQSPPTTTSQALPATTTTTPGNGDPAKCTRAKAVQNITFSKTKYPRIRAHFLKALRKGWPRTLVLNRKGADERRTKLLADIPTKRGYDRDEYPPAVGRGQGKGLTRGTNPVGWKADVAYVPSSENRSHGSSLGLKLRRFCSGTRFRYVFY